MIKTYEGTFNSKQNLKLIIFCNKVTQYTFSPSSQMNPSPHQKVNESVLV